MNDKTQPWKTIRIVTILAIVWFALIVPCIIIIIIVNYFLNYVLVVPQGSLFTDLATLSVLGQMVFGIFGGVFLAAVAEMTKRRCLFTAGIFWIIYFGSPLPLAFLTFILAGLFSTAYASLVVPFCIAAGIGAIASIFMIMDARVVRNWHLMVFPIIMMALFVAAMILYIFVLLLPAGAGIVGYSFRTASPCFLLPATIGITVVLFKENARIELELKES